MKMCMYALPLTTSLCLTPQIIYKYLKNLFNWRTITWQHCGVFCPPSSRISLRYTCIPWPWTLLAAPSPPRPSGLPQSTSFGCPASCIELALVICFRCGKVHVSMLFSEWNKSERERQILYINAYILNLEYTFEVTNLLPRAWLGQSLHGCCEQSDPLGRSWQAMHDLCAWSLNLMSFNTASVEFTEFSTLFFSFLFW